MRRHMGRSSGENSFRLCKLIASATVSLVLLSSPATAQIYGVKGYDGVGTPRWTLFRFMEDGSQFTVLGELRINNQPIQIDGLAISPQTGLVGFQLDTTAPYAEAGVRSRLVRIDTQTAAVTPIGNWFQGAIRAADFDPIGRLWAVDAAKNAILRVDPNTGAVISTMMINPALNVDYTCGFLITADGTTYLSQSYLDNRTDFYTVNLNTAQITLVASDTSLEPDCGNRTFQLQLVDIETSPNRPGAIFGLEVRGCDDIFIVGGPFNYPRSVLYSNIISSYNGGPGDLAALLSCYNCPPDVNADGIVDDADLLAVLFYFGQRCSNNE